MPSPHLQSSKLFFETFNGRCIFFINFGPILGSQAFFLWIFYLHPLAIIPTNKLINAFPDSRIEDIAIPAIEADTGLFKNVEFVNDISEKVII